MGIENLKKSQFWMQLSVLIQVYFGGDGYGAGGSEPQKVDISVLRV